MIATSKSESPFVKFNRVMNAQGVSADMSLPTINLCCSLIEQHRGRNSAVDALRELDAIKANHLLYQEHGYFPRNLKVDFQKLTAPRRPAGETIISDMDHLHADVVVVSCMDNRCTGHSEPLGKKDYQVCDIVSAGHDMVRKDLESLSVGVALKGASIVLLEAHGGACGAVQLALKEKEAGKFEHALTKQMAPAMKGVHGSDSMEVFAGTLINLDAQLKKILDPALELPLLSEKKGKLSFKQLMEEGSCLVMGVYVDFEVVSDLSGNRDVIKRLSFFDSVEAFGKFVDGKVRAYEALLKERAGA